MKRLKQKWDALLTLGHRNAIKLFFKILLHQLRILNLTDDILYKKYNNLLFLGARKIKYKRINDSLILCDEDPPKIPCKTFLRLDDSDVFVFYQIYLLEEYKPLIKIYHSYFGDRPEIIIDAGANIGLSSIYLASHFPDSKIICLEPEKSNFTQLMKNIKLTKHSGFHSIQKALWSSNENLSFSRNFRDKQSWSIQVLPTVTSEGNIPSISLNSIIEDFAIDKIDIIKIDIEGAEREIFKDREKALSFLSITRTLAIEIHEDLVDKLVIEEILEDAGFKLSREGESLFGYNKNFVEA